MNTLFPIYVKMDEIQTLVVGAGPVGLEKLQAIYRNSPYANVHVVAAQVSDEVYEFAENIPSLFISNRSFAPNDLDSKDLIILATNNAELNDEIRILARERHILLNVADKPDLCDFYLGSVVQKGNLKIGISTNGKSPTIAKRLKDFFNEVLPEEIDETLELMQTMRNQLKGDLQEKIKTLNAHTEDLVSSKKL